MFRSVSTVYRWMFARPIFRKFNTLLFRLSLRGLGILNYENSNISGEKYLIKKILLKVIRKKTPVFFDVGANVGNYTISLLETYPSAEVHVFEPHPGNFSALKSNLSTYNAKLYNFALGDTQDQLILYDRADHENGSSHASLHEAVISEIHQQDTLQFSVSVETLDEICKKENIREIDFLKIDTEGNELAVLNGAKKLLKENKIMCIHFEFNEMNIVSRTFFRDFRKLLHNHKFYRLLPHGLILLDDYPLATELFAYQNILAVTNSVTIQL